MVAVTTVLVGVVLGGVVLAMGKGVTSRPAPRDLYSSSRRRAVQVWW